MKKVNINKEVIIEKQKEFNNGFKDFAFKDNTVSMAIGIMIGAALKSVIDSLVKDILTPPIAKITSGIDFSNLFIVVGRNHYDTLEEAQSAGEVVITYGNFIDTFISFLITALVLYIIYKQVSRFNKKEKKKVVDSTRTCPYCKSKGISKNATRCPFCTSELKAV